MNARSLGLFDLLEIFSWSVMATVRKVPWPPALRWWFRQEKPGWAKRSVTDTPGFRVKSCCCGTRMETTHRQWHQDFHVLSSFWFVRHVWFGSSKGTVFSEMSVRFFMLLHAQSHALASSRELFEPQVFHTSSGWPGAVWPEPSGQDVVPLKGCGSLNFQSSRYLYDPRIFL